MIPFNSEQPGPADSSTIGGSRSSAAGRVLAAIALIGLVLSATGCGGGERGGGRAEGGGRGGGEKGSERGGPGGPGGKGGKKMIKIPIEVRQVQAYPVEYAIEAVGSVQAFERIEVVARVAGVIETISFEEGIAVKHDQILAKVDSERYRLLVSIAEASHNRALAAKAEAKATHDRRLELAKKDAGLVSKEELVGVLAKVDFATAEAQQAKASLDLANLDLKESSVSSPVDGIIQTRVAQTGQFVTRGQTIATLLRRDPLLLKFNVAGTDAIHLHNGMTLRFKVPGFDSPMSALISHVAAAADSQSRMVEVTARINDPDRDRLKPGAFAEITIPVDAQDDSPVIPFSAVRPSEKGFLAYVAENNVARERILTLGLRTATGQVEVKSGLAPGELLIVRGSDAVREGVEVEIETPAAPSPSPSAAPSPAVTEGTPKEVRP